jgi:uracil-DNA glycosylase
MVVSNPFAGEVAAPPEVPVTECRACPRLVEWRAAQAERVPPRFRDFVAQHGFWARPVAAFGDPAAWLAIVGLAPAAQGGNRTGRMFTGDRSGDFLYAALHCAGLAELPTSERRGDGQRLRGVLITAAARCAPPGNRLLAEELARCRGYLRHDLASLANLRVVLALGRIAHDAVLALLRAPVPGRVGAGGGVGERSAVPGPRFPAFAHGSSWQLPGGVWLVDSYHVSQRNTFTGLLSAAKFDRVLATCSVLVADGR